MFVKITRSKNYKYLQIVHSYRQDGKNKHKVIANLGRYDELKHNKQFIKVLKKLLKLVAAEELVVNQNQIQEVDRLNWGYLIYQKLWKKYGLEEELENYTKSSKIRFNFKLAVFLMVLDRLLYQRSKKGVYENQKIYWGINEEVELNHFYRSLDILCELKEKIEETLFFQRQDLFNREIDIVYYDVTTFHFESVISDELKDFGFSKNGKLNEVQVVMGLLIDTEGRPVGYELYPGNSFEGKTLLDSLQKLKKRFSIRKVIIVADRGMNNKLNLSLIKESGYDYIVSMRLRSLPSKLRKQVIDFEGYKSDGETGLKYKGLSHETVVKYINEKGEKITKRYNDRMNCTWSASRARKDKSDRERLIKKAQKYIEDNSSITRKTGARRYILTSGKEKITGVDREKINEDEQYDGFYVIQTSDVTRKPEEIYKAYHGLWKIEESFRVMKSTMKTRPIFHWTPKRIKGHFVVCFMAFLLERELELIL